MQSEKFKLTSHEIEKLCEAGGLAPSGGNAQPWKVIIDGNLINICVNVDRLTGFLDIGKYASFFALGCFMENLCIKADALGLIYISNVQNTKQNTDVSIKISFTGRVKSKSSALEPYIEKRGTNRKLYDGTIICRESIDQIKKVVSENKLYGFNLSTVSNSEEKLKVAEILGKIDGIRMTHNETYEDMMDEMRWSDDEARKTRDGLDIKTLELPANMDKMFRLLKKMSHMRRLIPAGAFEGMAKPVLTNCSHLCCLSMSPGLTPAKMVEAGRALERVWLTATKLGISFQPWTVLPFFTIRVHYFNGTGFSEQQQNVVKLTEKKLIQVFNISGQAMPIFIFRLSISKPSSARALKIYWKEFTEIKN